LLGWLNRKPLLEHTLPEPVSGKVGLWPKTGSVSLFGDFTVTRSALEKILLSWSTGKDSAWVLHLLAGRNVAGLITSFNTEADRVAMHAVRRSLAEAQARRIGLPLGNVGLPWPCSNAEYEAHMQEVWKRALGGTASATRISTNMTVLDLSSNAGLIGMGLLTINLLLGLLISVRYNPRKQWPHRRINIFRIHNWTAYVAISFILVHPMLLLFMSQPQFRVLDILWPLHSPGQTLYNSLGAVALYTGVFVVITSYFRFSLAHRLWKKFHYVAYVTAAVVMLHGILEDPNLKSLPPDVLDGEKILVEACCVLLIGATAWRVRYALRSKLKN